MAEEVVELEGREGKRGAARWELVTTADAVRLERVDLWTGRYQGRASKGWQGGAERGEGGLHPRSRARMRWLFGSLPWEMLGVRGSLVTLTYPGDWQEWVADGRSLERHRRAFAERWRRRFGTLQGVWVKEFQQSGRPHLHLYVALPESVSAEEFEGLRLRTIAGKKLEDRFGTYEGRRKLKPIGGRYGGEFGDWLLRAWSEVVGTAGKGEKHEKRGVDVRVCFWSEGAAEKDRAEVARYFYNESAKLGQKRAPEGFGPVGRYWGLWGASEGFKPVLQRVALSDDVGVELERRMALLLGWRLLVKAHRTGGYRALHNYSERRDGTGVTLYECSPADQARLLRNAEAAAARKRARRLRSVEE